MRAVVIPEIGVHELREIPKPQAGPGELLVQVGACGLCGTDLHILAGEFPGTRFPCIPGHEFAGTVADVGTECGDFRIGDRVGVMPSVFCGRCRSCRTGRANLCQDGGGFGSTYPGGFAEFAAVPAANAYRLPGSLSFSEAALIEPLSCVVHGFHRLSPRPGDTYLIYGGGTMGLMLAQYARFAGASAVALLTRSSVRLERARTFGFEILGSTLEDVRHVAPVGFDNVIEATGVTSVASRAFDAVVRGGKLLLFGVCPPGELASFEAFRIYNGEIDVIGSMAVHNSYQPALEAMAAGAIDAKRMVSHVFGIDGFDRALDVMRSGEGTKVQVDPTH